MTDDPIVEEIRQIRQAHATRYDNDLDRICEALREREIQSNRSVVKRNARAVLPKTGTE